MRQAPAKCHNCGRRDHLTEDCRKFVKVDSMLEVIVGQKPQSFGDIAPASSFPSGVFTGLPRCLQCGNAGHNTEECNTPLRCSRCGLTGHKLSSCRVKFCGRCGNHGHVVDTCQADASLTCNKCGRRGHLCKACPQYICRWCGKAGHRPMFCPENPRQNQRVLGRLDQRQRDTHAFYMERAKQQVSNTSCENETSGTSINLLGEFLPTAKLHADKTSDQEIHTDYTGIVEHSTTIPAKPNSGKSVGVPTGGLKAAIKVKRNKKTPLRPHPTDPQPSKPSSSASQDLVDPAWNFPASECLNESDWVTTHHIGTRHDSFGTGRQTETSRKDESTIAHESRTSDKKILTKDVLNKRRRQTSDLSRSELRGTNMFDTVSIAPVNAGKSLVSYDAGFESDDVEQCINK